MAAVQSDFISEVLPNLSVEGSFGTTLLQVKRCPEIGDIHHYFSSTFDAGQAVKTSSKLTYITSHRYAAWPLWRRHHFSLSPCSSPFDIPTKIAFNAWV